jgi:hypothetical protein
VDARAETFGPASNEVLALASGQTWKFHTNDFNYQKSVMKIKFSELNWWYILQKCITFFSKML